VSAHWTGDSHPPDNDSSVTAWAERIAAMSAARRGATGVRYTAARLPWIRLVLDSVAAHGTLSSLVRAAMGRVTPARERR
jgi:hypothetical protein